MTPSSAITLAGDDLVALREIVVVALLAPAADAAGGEGEEGSAPVEDVRRAAGLLEAIGWPEDPPAPASVTPADAALGRTAVLIALSGAAERAWEESVSALDEDAPYDGREAIADVVRCGRLLALLSGENPDQPGPPAATGARPASAILAAIPDGLVVVDAAGRLEWMNERARDLLSGDVPFPPPGALESRAARLAAGLCDGAAGGAERVVPIEDRTGLPPVPLAARATDLPSGGRVVVVRPGALRSLVGRPPRDGEDAFRMLVEDAPTIIWTADRRGNITYANTALCRLAARPMAEIVGVGWRDCIHPDDLPGVELGYRAALDEQRDFELEFRVLRPGGDSVWVISRASARTDDAGRFVGYVGALHDVSARRRAEDRLREVEAELHDATARTPLLWTCDARGRLTFASRDWEAVTGRPPGDVLGHGWLFGVHPGDRPRVAEAFASAAEGAEPVELAFRLGAGDGGHRWYLMTGVPRGSGGLAGFCDDVTARRRDACRDAAIHAAMSALAADSGTGDVARVVAAQAGAVLGASRVEVVVRDGAAERNVAVWAPAGGETAADAMSGPSVPWSAVATVAGDGHPWGEIRVACPGAATAGDRVLLDALGEILGLAAGQVARSAAGPAITPGS